MRQFWSAVSAVAAIVAIVVAIGIYVDTQKGGSKSITISSFGSFDLLSSFVKFPKEKLALTFDGKPINNYSVISIHIENSGRKPIRKEDFDQPIIIYFKGVSRIISFEKRFSFPFEIPVKSKIDENRVILESCLLNPSDTIIMEVGVIPVEGSRPDIDHVTGRIVGVKRIIYRSSEMAIKDTLSKFRKSKIIKDWLVLSTIILLTIALIASNWERLVSAIFSAIKKNNKIKPDKHGKS